jgi:putative FmdB family regulatory protein
MSSNISGVNIMPTYELFCNDCNIEFEEFCKISDKDKLVCPNCKGNNIKTLVSSKGNIAFGNSWYTNGHCRV